MTASTHETEITVLDDRPTQCICVYIIALECRLNGLLG